ncbi:Fic family protein [Aquiflexum sp. LQ15W]|uniref:Fic family protein n=1 Tax=Cognataquiflexum nitidum TaxID=2922272 RepID=UPI001F13DC57|nr:Fic family protein [Cognataquiflexum nitidum]MCH6199523.1 Fic family protein [Cognataquiflexum nitidum]
MYIHERENWTNFIWDNDKLTPILASVRHLQGRLLGRMESLGFDFIERATLESLILDVVDTSRIEGEFLNPKLVRSSIARKLGIENADFIKTSRNIEGIVDVILDATQNFDKPLSETRLLGWHNSLFQTGFSGFQQIDVAKYRSGGMKVVSGNFGKEKIHFEAPSADKVQHEMEQFLNWLNSDTSLDLVLKAIIAHFWFVTIHPFDDGNGRIARAIFDMWLAKSDNSKIRFYSLSNQIFKEHKYYNNIIEETQKGTSDITKYVEWFLGCFERALISSEQNLEIILDKAHFWGRHKSINVNERQRLVINYLYDNYSKKVGFLRTSTYAKLTKCSTDTALRDLQDLVTKEMLKTEDSGKKTNYVIVSPKNIRIPKINEK